MAKARQIATVPLDAAWLRAHPLPTHVQGTDKNSRGRVLLVGGSRRVPGGLRLTCEASFRAGAGKVQIATIKSCAIALGTAVPEAGIIALGEDADGEVARSGAKLLSDAITDCDALVLGPAMTKAGPAKALLTGLLTKPRPELCVLLDAAALAAACGEEKRLRRLDGRLVLTPHVGEMAALLDCEATAVEAEPAAHALRAAERFNGYVIMKGSETIVATPDGSALSYSGGGVGLATGGSGDVLAGIVAGLIARGCAPLIAAGWGVWLHGEAGRRLAERVGPIGFLARELPALVPGLIGGAG